MWPKPLLLGLGVLAAVATTVPAIAFGGVPDQHAFVASVENPGAPSGERFCSATVVSSTWLVTAARCATGDPAKMTVRIGSRSGVVVGVSERVTHPDYRPGAQADIALLRLNVSLLFHAVAPIVSSSAGAGVATAREESGSAADPGTPRLVMANGRWELAGLVLRGGASTDVTAYRDWIAQHLR